MKRQFFIFLMVGTLGFVIDAGLTQLLSYMGAHPLIARLPAIGIAVIVTFLLNKVITFEAKELCATRSFAAYIVTQGASQTLNFAVYSLLVMNIALFYTWTAAAVMIGSVCAMSVTFLLSKYWVFKKCL